MPQAELVRFIRAGMEQDREGMTGAPQVLRDFFIEMPPANPPWLDYEAFIPGIRAFHWNSGLILSGFAAVSWLTASQPTSPSPSSSPDES